MGAKHVPSSSSREKLSIYFIAHILFSISLKVFEVIKQELLWYAVPNLHLVHSAAINNGARDTRILPKPHILENN
jgi:hypothetical protein